MLSGTILAAGARFSSAASIFLYPSPENSPAGCFFLSTSCINDGKIFVLYKIFLLRGFYLCIAGTPTFLPASALSAEVPDHNWGLFPYVLCWDHLLSDKNPVPWYKIYFPRLHLFIPEARLLPSFAKSSWFALEILFGI